MAAVCHPASGKITATFGPVAKHYGVEIAICPSRHGNRKGVVEKGNHCLAQRWWRTLPGDTTITGAQTSLDQFCVRVGDVRTRRRDGVTTAVAALAATEPLRTAPPAYPVSVTVERVVSAQALVAFAGNFYSIGPGMSGTTVTVRHRLGESSIEILTGSGVVLARHRREPDGAGVVVRADEHVVALEHAVLAGFTDRAPCRSKERRPPSAAALAEAVRLSGTAPQAGDRVVVDFADYVAAAKAASATLLAVTAPAQEASDE